MSKQLIKMFKTMKKKLIPLGGGHLVRSYLFLVDPDTQFAD